MIFLLLCLNVVGDLGFFVNMICSGSELVSQNASLLIPEDDAASRAGKAASAKSGMKSGYKKGGKKWNRATNRREERGNKLLVVT